MNKQAVNVFGVVLWRLGLIEQMNELCSLFCGCEVRLKEYPLSLPRRVTILLPEHP